MHKDIEMLADILYANQKHPLSVKSARPIRSSSLSCYVWLQDFEAKKFC